MVDLWSISFFYRFDSIIFDYPQTEGETRIHSEEFRDMEQEEKKMRARYKGVSRDSPEAIPATPSESLHEDNREKRAAVYVDFTAAV